MHDWLVWLLVLILGVKALVLIIQTAIIWLIIRHGIHYKAEQSDVDALGMRTQAAEERIKNVENHPQKGKG